MSAVESSIDELMQAFHDSLCALAPIVEKAHIKWREDEAYDPWENIAVTLFQEIVGSCVENITSGSVFGLPVYDVPKESYKDCSYITESGAQAIFLGFRTEKTAFDTCLFQTLNEQAQPTKTYKKKFSETQFALALRDKDGSLQPERLAVYYDQ